MLQCLVHRRPRIHPCRSATRCQVELEASARSSSTLRGSASWTAGGRRRAHCRCRLGHGQWSSSLDGATTRRRSSGPLSEWSKNGKIQLFLEKKFLSFSFLGFYVFKVFKGFLKVFQVLLYKEDGTQILYTIFFICHIVFVEWMRCRCNSTKSPAIARIADRTPWQHAFFCGAGDPYFRRTCVRGKSAIIVYRWIGRWLFLLAVYSNHVAANWSGLAAIRNACIWGSSYSTPVWGNGEGGRMWSNKLVPQTAQSSARAILSASSDSFSVRRTA